MTASADLRRETVSAARSSGAEHIAWVCSDPCGTDDVCACVSASHDAGFTRVGLVATGAPAFAETLRALQAAGLNEVELPVHAATPDAHDHVSGRVGGFATIAAELDACRSVGLRTLVRTLLCRANYRLLDDLAAYVARQRVAGWCLDVPTSQGTDGVARAQFERTHPRLALAVPFALRAIDRARGLGVDAWVRGVPLCLLGPMTTRSLPSESRAYAPTCGDCSARASCAGVDAVYLERFGGDELRRRYDAVTICDDDPIGSSFAVASTTGRHGSSP